MKNKQEISLNSLDEVVIVEPIPLGKYPELLRSIEKLPQHLSDFGSMSEDQIVAKLPNIIAESYSDVSKLLSIVTNLSEDQISRLSLDEATDIVLAIIEVNQFTNIFGKVKKALARPKTKESLKQ